MAPEYVQPYVKAQKNDDRDAEAATRPAMRFRVAEGGGAARPADAASGAVAAGEPPDAPDEPAASDPSRAGHHGGEGRRALAHPSPGEARHAPAGAARHALTVGLHLRRGLPGPRGGGPARHALRRYQRDERTFRRGCPHRRRGPTRFSLSTERLARRARAHRAGQYLPRRPRALQSRTQPRRERLALSPRQLTRDQRHRRRRRHRRCRLLRVESLR